MMSERAVVASTTSTTNEMKAAEILLSLRSLIECERRNAFSVRWASKRKRSTASSEPSPPPPPLPPLPLPESPKLPVKPSSPVTTLAVWRSETDDKAEDSTRRKSKRRKRGEYRELRSRVEELMKENRLFAEELENKSTDYEQLRAVNVALKVKKIELTIGRRLPELDMLEEKSSNLTSTSGDHYQQFQSKIHTDQTTKRRRLGTESCTTEVLPYQVCQVGPTLPSAIGSSEQNQNHLSPLGIPDLNLFPEEFIC